MANMITATIRRKKLIGYPVCDTFQRIIKLPGSRSIGFNYAYQNKGQLSADNFFTITLGF